MASPKKKWLRRKLAVTAAQEAQPVEVAVQPEPVVTKVAPKPAPIPPQRSSRRRTERKK